MQQIRRVFRWVMFILAFGLFHYVLPQHDVVRVTSTEIIRTDFSGFNRLFYAQADSGAAELTTRDLRLINTEKQKTFLLGFVPRDSTEIMVYRNEDSGWIWPPYFKFDSSNLQAEAQSLVANATEPQYAMISHYGWRIPFLSIYPNAVAIKPVDGPDYYPIPWFSILFFIFVGFCIGMIRAMFRQFRERTVDPLLDSAEDQYTETRGRVGRWLDTWKSK